MDSGFYTYLRCISVVFCSFLLRSKVPVFEERTKKERRSNGAEGFWRGGRGVVLEGCDAWCLRMGWNLLFLRMCAFGNFDRGVGWDTRMTRMSADKEFFRRCTTRSLTEIPHRVWDDHAGGKRKH